MVFSRGVPASAKGLPRPAAFVAAAIDSAAVDDATLAALLIAGDERAGRVCFERFSSLVRGVVRRSLGPEHDAEDVVQDVFARVFERISTLRDRSMLRSFVVGVAVHSVRYELRRRRVRRLVGLSPAEPSRELHVVETDSDARRALVRFYRMLDELRTRDRTAFVLRHVEGMELTEVADALGLSVPTVRRRLAHCWSRVAALAAGDPVLDAYLARRRQAES